MVILLQTSETVQGNTQNTRLSLFLPLPAEFLLTKLLLPLAFLLLEDTGMMLSYLHVCQGP